MSDLLHEIIQNTCISKSVNTCVKKVMQSVFRVLECTPIHQCAYSLLHSVCVRETVLVFVNGIKAGCEEADRSSASVHLPVHLPQNSHHKLPERLSTTQNRVSQ